MRQPKPKIALLACPFCGSSRAPMFWNSDDARYKEEGAVRILTYAVVCDTQIPAGRGGCGGSGGFKNSVQLAADAWNRRG